MCTYLYARNVDFHLVVIVVERNLLTSGAVSAALAETCTLLGLHWTVRAQLDDGLFLRAASAGKELAFNHRIHLLHRKRANHVPLYLTC